MASRFLSAGLRLLGSIPSVGKSVKKTASKAASTIKSIKSKASSKKQNLATKLKNAKKKLKLKGIFAIGKVVTKARKIKNNLSINESLQKLKLAMKGAVLATSLKQQNKKSSEELKLTQLTIFDALKLANDEEYKRNREKQRQEYINSKKKPIIQFGSKLRPRVVADNMFNKMNNMANNSMNNINSFLDNAGNKFREWNRGNAYTVIGGYKDFWNAPLPPISTNREQADANITRAQDLINYYESLKNGKNEGWNQYYSKIQEPYKQWQEDQRELIESRGTIYFEEGNAYVKLAGGGHFLLGGEGDIKYDGEYITINVRGGVSGKMGLGGGLTGGLELRTGKLEGNIINSTSASGGALFMGEGAFNTDGENYELVTGAGFGGGVNIKLVQLDTSLYKEKELIRIRAPLPEAGARYEGSPTVEDWLRSINSKGWGQ